MSASTIPDLLHGLLAADPARPLLTFYDDATGERIELSVTSFDNWVAKTANLLQDELGVEPGEPVALCLPTHWQTAVWICACAACGVTVVLDPDDVPEDTDVTVCGPDRVQEATRAAPCQVVALSLQPMGRGFDEKLPDGATDYAASVLAQPDVFVPVGAPDADAPFVVSTGGSTSQRELIAQARERAEVLGLHPGGRLLTDANPADTTGLTGGVLAAMATGGSVVLNRHPDPTAIDGRVTQEHVTAQWWAGR